MAHKDKEIIKRTSDMTAAEYNKKGKKHKLRGEVRKRKQYGFKKNVGQKIYANK